MSKIKQLPLPGSLFIFVFGVLAPVFLGAMPVSALPVTETITPTAWQTGSGSFLAIAQAGTPAPSITIASRNTPGTVINPGLDSPEEPDGSYSASGTGQTISTTAGNLSNIASFVNFESVSFGGAHYQASAVLGLPTITLTYDNAT